MLPLLLAMPGNETMTKAIGEHLGADVAELRTHSFPDGETYLRIESDVQQRQLAIVATMDRPNAKMLPLLFAADAAHELGAARVGLIAPYLAYMRQDRRFQPGEAITSRTVARLLSASFDWLVTVDPHLHRYKSLAEIYSIPTCALHAAQPMSDWIAGNVSEPVLIGPDAESVQWVGDVAQRIGAPFTVLEKTRRGDRDVTVRLRDGGAIEGRTPVLLDDIISSGQTILQALRLLGRRTRLASVCVAVHGIFADGSDALLAAEGARVVTSNSIPHPSNAIDVSHLLARGAAREMTGEP